MYLPQDTASISRRRMSPIPVLLFAATVIFGASLVLFTSSAAGPELSAVPVSESANSRADERARVAKSYGKLPLSFEINKGQADERVRFISHGVGYSLFLTPDEAVLTLRAHSSSLEVKSDAAEVKTGTTAGYNVLRMKLVRANSNPKTVGLEELPGKLNYFIGNDPAKWTIDVPLYSKVQYQGVYKGIDLVYYGNQRQLEYDFLVAPGSDPRAIRIKFEGAEQIKVDDEDGSLVLAVDKSEVRLKKPVIYQVTEDGSRREIKGGYTVKGKAVQFQVANFDSTKALVIDPILSYSTYLGSGFNETGWGIAVDGSGSAYVTGGTGSFAFPTTGVNFIPPNTSGHAFVTKLDPSGSSLVYSTLIGGSSTSIGFAIALDAIGAAHITGRTLSTDFPTANAIRANTNLLKSANGGGGWTPSNAGLGNLPVLDIGVNPAVPTTIYAAVASGTGIYKSSDSGSTWSALNTGATFVTALAVDPQTPTTIYATVNNPFFGAIKSSDAGATWTQINNGLSGGFLNSIAVDPQTPATVYAGTSGGGVFKSTNGGASWQPSNTGLTFTSAFSFAIDPTSPATLYLATGFGGVFKSANGGGNWVQMNTGLANAVVNTLLVDPTNPLTLYAGTAGGGIFKTTDGAGSWGPVNNGLTVTSVRSLALDPASPATIYAGTTKSSIFKSVNGGSSWTGVYSALSGPAVEALVVAPSNLVYAGVDTRLTSTDSEGFVTKLNPAGNALVFSTFLGGGGEDEGDGIAVDSAGNVIVAGQTASTDFPLANPRQSTLQGTTDAFVSKLTSSGAAFVYSTYLGGTSGEFGRAVAVDSSGSAYIAGDTGSLDFPTTPGAFQTTPGNGPFSSDAFVTKIDSAGSAFLYSTYLGGNGSDGAFGIAVDAAGNAFVSGFNNSLNFPLLNPAQSTFGGAFVTKLNAAGSGLAYSTYLGGGGGDQARGIAVDSSGNAYVTGFTRSANFRTTPDALKSKSGVFKTTNGGATWNNNNSGLAGPVQDLALNPVSLDLYAATTDGVYKSTNLGQTWVASNNGLTNLETTVLAVDPQTPATIYVGEGSSGAGLFKSTNGGSSWSSANGNQNFTTIGAIAIDPLNTGTVYLSTNSFSFKSTNAGVTWNQIGGFELLFVTSFAIDPQNPQIVYASINSSGGGIAKSTDGGTTWALVNNGLDSTFANRVVIDPSNTSTLYAGTNLGVFKSTNGGGTWTNILGTSSINNLAIDPTSPATVYATTFNGSFTGNAIFKTVNGGTTWAPLASEKIQSAGRLLVDPQTPTTLYVVSNPGFDDDAFVTKFSAAGSLLYSTYLGGQTNPGDTPTDFGFGIAADNAGNAYVTGLARSKDFPVTPDSFQPINRGFDDAFIAKLSPSFLISGVVTDAGSVPQSGVKITLSGSRSDSLLTGSDGTYLFTNLQMGGSYTVSATKTGFAFSPPAQSFANLNADQIANFILSPSGTPFHTISGKTAEADGTPIPGVTISLTGSQIEFGTTDSAGNYSFSAPDGGSYTVTPSIVGFVFSPLNQSVNNLSANTQVNFTGARQDFVVTNTNDHGAGSLLQAITDANATFGPDRIIFQIPGAGIHTIRPIAPLPEITDPVTIDGATQPGFSGSPLIELDGSMVNGNGLTISGGNSTVRGLVINRFTSNGITLMTNGGNHIEGNIIGLDPTGSIRRPNGSGISLNLSSSNIIGGTTPAQRNVVSGNNGNGIALGPAGNQIKGNYIGTNAAGTAALTNIDHGIILFNITGQPPDPNQIGGTEPGAGNVISGNGRNGIDVSVPGTVIQGNLIGTDATGTSKIANANAGVYVNFGSAVVGGTTPSARNIISGNGVGVVMGPGVLKGNYIGTDITGTVKLGNGTGVSCGNATVGGTEPGAGNLISGNDVAGIQTSPIGNPSTIQGNLIGTDVTGSQPLGNLTGISMQSSQNVIGGSQPGARNVISGNRVAIQIGGLVAPGPIGNIVRGNYIGLNSSGTSPVGNSLRGVEINDSTNNVIGGDQPGEGNFIAFNDAGVVVSQASFNNLIEGNSIFSNSSLGIDLNFDNVVTPNDPSDADVGANRLQNFPVLSALTVSQLGTNIKGSLNSLPNTQFQIDFYSNLACDGSGNGEGAVPFGSTQVTTDALGNAVIDQTFPGQLAANRVITATATDPAGNTSEFSPCDASASAGNLEFAAFDFNVLEDVGSAVIRVVRNGGSRGTLTVNYATGSGTATSGSDFTPASGVLTFADGETQKTFNVPIADDGVTESEETVQLTLSGTANLESLGAKFSATLHIFDSNTPLTISGIDVQIVEGNAGQKNVVVPITLSAATSRTVTVNYATISGSGSSGATSGVDFLPTSGTLTFGPGVDTKEVLVAILGDTLDEFDETFTVGLTNAVNATVFIFPQVRILDDDPLPTLSITDVSVAEGAGAKAVFAVRLSSPSGRTVQVNFATADGSATAGNDYTSTSGFLNFSVGQTVKHVEVPIVTDQASEPDETFFVNLQSPFRATIADGQGVGTIIDSGTNTSLVQFSAAVYNANEADGQVQITVTRSGSTAGESVVNYQTVSQSASDRSDFTPAVGALRFAPDETSKTFNVLLTDDAFLESSESLDLVLTSPVGASLGGPNVATLTITSNDVATGPSPVREDSFDTRFFVRQHYHDFLNREPDDAGLNFWVDQIDSCTTDQCRELKKINVSAAFFLSIEFQETGYLVYRMYNVAYGETTSPNVPGTVPIVRLTDFLPDTQQIGLGVQVGIGNWQQQLEDNKNAYALDFVQRQRFLADYPLTMTAGEFVAKLDQNSGGVLSANEKTQLIALLGATPADATKRASVVKQVAEDSDLKQRELNRAFVLMQYYGYLRRNPDDPQDADFRGWKFWLDKLDQFNGNFVNADMVKSFLVSGEYRNRFGTP